MSPARSSKMALFALMLSAFAIGTTEFVIMGILPQVATDLQVSLPDAGLLVTGYALGVALGGPIITACTGRISRTGLMISLMTLFILGNLLGALAPNYTVLMVARVLTALAHGTFFAVGAVAATQLVEKEKQASAVAMMFSGLTIANILGVPLGTWIGQSLGWRATFWMVSVFGVIAWGGLVWLVPKIAHSAASNGLRQELRVLGNRQVVLALLMTVFGFGGVFTAFTYIAPILTDITGVAARFVTPILLLFGVGMTIGNLYGGKWADRKLMPALIALTAALCIILVIFAFTSHSVLPALLTIPIWGFAAFGICPGLQMRVLEQASGAPTLASALNISSFNVANAGGAWLGGVVLESSYGLTGVIPAAALVTAIGLLLSIVSWSIDKRHVHTNQPIQPV